MQQLHLFFLGSRQGRTLAGVLASSREQESRALCLESQQPASSIFSRSDDTAAACFFSPLSRSGYNGNGGPCCQLWHAASEPCQSPHVHLPK